MNEFEVKGRPIKLERNINTASAAHLRIGATREQLQTASNPSKRRRRIQIAKSIPIFIVADSNMVQKPLRIYVIRKSLIDCDL